MADVPEFATTFGPQPTKFKRSISAAKAHMVNTHQAALRAWDSRRRNLQLKRVTRAISIRQPYAEMTLCGKKRQEYRSRPTSVRERVYLYAALAAGHASDWQSLGKRPGELPKGKVVGAVEKIGCR